MPTISIPRKSTKKRLFREDEFSKFLDKDLINDFSCVNESLCPAGYSCTKYEDHVVYYKMEISEKLAAITSYFPERSCGSNFLKLINAWWVVSNSKTKFNSNNRLGNAAISGDNKPTFLRALADWIGGMEG